MKLLNVLNLTISFLECKYFMNNLCALVWKKGLMYLGGYYFGFRRVAIYILLPNNSPMSLLPASMNCIRLISMIWFTEVTVYIIGVTSVNNFFFFFFLVPRDIKERGRDLDQVLNQYMYFVKPAFEEFCSPVSIYIFICNFFL
jgi:hypothetical protein